MRYILAICSLFFAFCGTVHSQDLAVKKSTGFRLPYVVQGKDTLPVYTMEETDVVEKLDEETIKKQKAWNTMVYDVIRVWPYASMCGGKMKQLDSNLASLNHKKEQKQYLKSEEEHLKSNYEERLKNLNYRQGRLLIKLIDRQTGVSSYGLIKQYKNGMTAFAYQSVASMFGMDLKAKYDPQQEVLIEQVIKYLGYK